MLPAPVLGLWQGLKSTNKEITKYFFKKNSKVCPVMEILLNSKLRLLKFGIEEAKFLKSPKDVKIFFSQKIPLFFPRFRGNLARKTEVPLALQIEPTNNCNLSCKSCPRDRMSREKGFMDFDLFTKIVDDAAFCHVKRIHLFLHGEPLLHPRIVDMIAYIKKAGMGITISTNGMLLNRDKIERILMSGVDSGDYINFSFLAGLKEPDEKGRANILEFLRLRKALKINGPVLVPILYSKPGNLNEEKEFHSAWDGIVDHVKIVESVSNASHSWGTEGTDLPERKCTCPNIWERLTVCWNGDVPMCCMDISGAFLLGNMKTGTIREMWGSSKMNAFKEMHIAGKVNELELCRHCNI